MPTHTPMSVSKRSVLWRGLRKSCPNCGEGKLFTGYIKQVENCSCCGEDIGHIRADDGPAWLTILITGHIIAPLIGFFALYDFNPEWLAVVSPLVLACIIMFFLLPPAKGLFIAALWLMSQKKVRNSA
ncbi:MAG: DUF983 domain-containing protein [Pseudobdellovibrionaceae bacterium]